MVGKNPRKVSVTLGGVPISAVGSVVWKIQTGAQPYQATFTVHKSGWNGQLASQVGKPLVLEINDIRGQTRKIRDVYIRHLAPSGSPNHVSFIVADKRWKWSYSGFSRDYNITKKTGDRTAKNAVPVELTQIVDKYDFQPYSLNNGAKWTAKDAVEDLLKSLEPSGKIVIESFPVKDSGEGQFTLQNVRLNDSSDVALSRLLSYIPGAEVYVDTDGIVRVFNGTDLQAAEKRFQGLGPNTWAGQKAEFVNRRAIRPKLVNVHYQRELEMLLEFKDDYGATTVATPNRNAPFVENVIPTVDPETTVEVYDPELGRVKRKTVPAGTWVEVKAWLKAMEETKPAKLKTKWDFDTIRVHWLKGDLDGALGVRIDESDKNNVFKRVQALKQHFRQTFRINRRFMERIKDIKAVRAAQIDPISGDRAPAAVWGQACLLPTNKGKRVPSRIEDFKGGYSLNVDYLPQGGENVIDVAPGPTELRFIDKALGIFRLEWIISPYGDVESFIPCLLVNSSGVPAQMTRNLKEQRTKAMGAGMRLQGANNGIFLKKSMEFKAMVTIVPASPNNKKRYHVETKDPKIVKQMFSADLGIEKGVGPELDVFIPPTEATARFAWTDDSTASSSIGRLLGLDNEDPNAAGIEGAEIPGFTPTNFTRELSAHSASVAAEVLTPFADNIQGSVATTLDAGNIRLKGNMVSSAIGVSGSTPIMLHEFPGQQKRNSRLALMPESVRHMILGIVPLGGSEK